MLLTVGELKRQLSAFSDDHELQLPGGLTFYRFKQRGDDLVVMEVDALEALLSDRFKRKFPEVKVAFCSFESDGSALRIVYVPEL